MSSSSLPAAARARVSIGDLTLGALGLAALLAIPGAAPGATPVAAVAGGAAASWGFHALVATLYAGVAVAVLTLRPTEDAGPGLGWANRVTLARLVIALPVAGHLASPSPLDEGARWAIVLLGTVALALDGVDGWVARRTDTASAFGARFDMETDAALILVLSVLVWQSGQTGAWVVAIGALRYLFVAGGRVLPALRGDLPPSLRRKVVCVVQGVALLVALGPVVPPALATVVAALALALLAGSFWIDTAWLLRAAREGSDRPAAAESTSAEVAGRRRAVSAVPESP